MNPWVLTLDLGNTALAGGVWRGKEFWPNRPLPLAGGVFSRRLQKWFRGFVGEERIDAGILASVVPRKTAPILRLCREFFGIDCHLLSAQTPTGLKILYDHPEQVGADRIANSVGAYHLYGGPAIVVDFGTAITFDVVTKKFEYLGGVIAPGLGISTQALFQKAALLPRVTITLPEKILGRNTVAAIQAGVYYGTLGLVERIIRELKRELRWGRETRLIATGGQAELILSRSRLINTIDPLLTLKGLFLISSKLTQR